jgi:miniconductance mechanosensitive channel
MVDFLKEWLLSNEMNETTAQVLAVAAAAVTVILAAWIVNYVTKRIILAAVSLFIKQTRTKWDDVLLKRKVFVRLSHIAPALVLYFAAPWFPEISGVIVRFSQVYIIIAGLSAIFGLLDAVDDVYRDYDVSRHRPIKGYLQVAKIVLAVFVAIYVFGVLTGQNVGVIIGGLGAMTAVLLLVFKDAILGLVASVQLSSNDMVRIGDWIEMPKYNADGDVTDVTLTTIKVQNWDKTITTIPAYALIADSFKNWRGMSESGGRRIKRCLYIDLASIKFCTDEMLGRFQDYHLIKDYVKTRREEVEEFNKKHGYNTSQLINGRRLTNVGTFRAYMGAYLRSHPKIHQDMTFLIRHLPPGPTGLPIEVYVFSNDQEWANYEAIQADIFDHLLAVLPLFELRAYQNPSGHDLQALSRVIFPRDEEV